MLNQASRLNILSIRIQRFQVTRVNQEGWRYQREIIQGDIDKRIQRYEARFRTEVWPIVQHPFERNSTAKQNTSFLTSSISSVSLLDCLPVRRRYVSVVRIVCRWGPTAPRMQRCCRETGRYSIRWILRIGKVRRAEKETFIMLAIVINSSPAKFAQHRLIRQQLEGRNACDNLFSSLSLMSDEI